MHRILVFVFLLCPILTKDCAAQETARGEAALDFPPSGKLWEHVTPAAVGWDEAKLNAALDFAGERASSGVVILHRGRILAERYWELNAKARLPDGRRNRYFFLLRGRDEAGHTIEDVASVQKSVVSLLAGIAQEKGLLSLDDPVDKHLGPHWSKASREQEAEITLRHLVSMSSGLNDALEFEAAPGTRWRYNTAAYAHTLQAVAAAAKQEPNELTRAWLTEPLGMADSRWVERRRGADAVNALGFATTARDLARLGLLVLAGGKWNGEATVPADHLRAALRSSQEMNPSYGYLWWLNGQSAFVRGARRVRGPLLPEAPADLVAALGALGRKVYVVPSLGLVVTRLGDDPNAAGGSFDREFWKRLMAAAPGERRKR